ncbi:MAG: hypothetical protein COV98_03480 [Candidatus Altarchaeum sp. CG12_big_fil_rev_8_21_14_0_65_33_22]|nr:MAG: hypothetical protein COV98_03480 [Candidatus Altarchaeum sp. CG12_big_fil_rev_8_21_14_0_65_33_22]
MKIINKTKKFTIAGNAKFARTFFERFKGLMLSNPGNLVIAAPKETIKHTSIHTCFMRFPLNVLWLNSDFEVVDVAKKTGNRRIFKPNKPAKYVVEIGTGDIGKTKIGDKIEFIE